MKKTGSASQEGTRPLWTTITSYARLFVHPDTPWKVKGILAIAVLYLLSPFDLIPDWIVGLGWIDDLALVSLLVGLAIKLVTRAHDSEPHE